MTEAVIGHSEARQAVAVLLAEKRLPHALLFHGPRGIGKRLMAQRLAWRLICGPAESDEAAVNMFGDSEPVIDATLAFADGNLAAQLAAGSCPDFHVLEPEEGKKSIGVKAVLAVLEQLRRSADNARVCLIDSVDDLTEEAANMLLKSLEEPRHGIYFLLVSHQLNRVLPTIRSRCRLVGLKPLAMPECEEVLERIGASADLAAMAHGCPGMVCGEKGKKRLELIEKIKQWQQGAAEPAYADGLVDVMAELMADEPIPNLKMAEMYAKLKVLQAQQAEYNLPANLVQAAAFAVLAELRNGQK